MDELNQRVLEVGRIHELQGNYEKTLLLLSALKSGSVGLDEFAMVSGGWFLIPKPVVADQVPGPIVMVEVPEPCSEPLPLPKHSGEF